MRLGLPELVVRLRRLNPSAVVEQAIRGEVGPDILFRGGSPREANTDAALQVWLDAAHRDETAHTHEAETGENPSAPDCVDQIDDHHLHDSDIRTFSFWLDQPLHPVGLQMWFDQMAALRGPNLLRVKGILNVEGRPTAVHAVQHLFHPPEELDRWPSDDRRSRIVFITHKLQRADIEASLAVLSFRPQTLELSPGKITAATFGAAGDLTDLPCTSLQRSRRFSQLLSSSSFSGETFGKSPMSAARFGFHCFG